MIKSVIKTYFKSEISIGITLLLVTIFSLLIVNSQNFQIYENFFLINAPLDIGFIGIYKDLTIREWINDAFMAIFFLLVGLELKQEILVGELSSKKKLALPAICAIGGVLVPALIYVFFNISNKESLDGFAVPTATDIAFAYGMISLFGKKIPNSLKVFLVALAVLDDLMAILIIAFFYTQNFAPEYLLYGIIPLIGMSFLNLKNSNKTSLYLILGAFLWLMVLKSGIHATLAGVITALFIPLHVKQEEILHDLAKKIAPVVNFLILPIFAFANAGVRIEDFSISLLTKPIVLGVISGLFFGKQIGVMLLAIIMTKLKLASIPKGSNWLEFYGAAIFTGIGFTMSLFIGSLAFIGNNEAYDQVKIGVLIGSLLSMIYGLFICYLGTYIFDNLKRNHE